MRLKFHYNQHRHNVQEDLFQIFMKDFQGFTNVRIALDEHWMIPSWYYRPRYVKSKIPWLFDRRVVWEGGGVYPGEANLRSYSAHFAHSAYSTTVPIVSVWHCPPSKAAIFSDITLELDVILILDKLPQQYQHCQAMVKNEVGTWCSLVTNLVMNMSPNYTRYLPHLVTNSSHCLVITKFVTKFVTKLHQVPICETSPKAKHHQLLLFFTSLAISTSLTFITR